MQIKLAKAEIAALKQKEQPTQEPVGRFVKATYGDYAVLAWHPSYVAKIGDCLYTHPAPTQQAQKPDLWKTQFLTDVMTSAGLLMHGRTDKKLAQRIADGSARWRTELYASAPTQPSLSDEADKPVDRHTLQAEGKQGGNQ